MATPFRAISRNVQERMLPQIGKKINSYRCMSYFGTKESSAISTKFSRHHCYSLTTNTIIEAPQHPMHERTKRTWAARTDPLWWSCITYPDVGTKPRVIRSHLARRLKQSFVESLRKAGYARDGTRLPGSGQGNDLVCSVQISPRPTMLQMKDEELRGQTDLLVKMIKANLTGRLAPKQGVWAGRKELKDLKNKMLKGRLDEVKDKPLGRKAAIRKMK